MEMKELLKIDVAVRNNNKKNINKQQQRIVVFKEKLEKTMKFWPRDAFDRIPIEEDRQFLTSMMGNRGATMVGADELLHSTEQKVHQRNKLEEERLRKEQVRQESLAAAAQAQVPQEDAEDEEVREDDVHVLEPTTPVRSHKRVVKTGSPAFWPHDVMRHPAVVETATRNKASGTSLSALTHSFVTATSGDHSKINMHAKTVYKSVDDVVASAALRAVKLHLWYLTPELLPLCLFSSAVDDHLKAKIVKEMLKHPKKASMTNRYGTDFGKPKFPDIPLSEEETSLLNFVGEDCWRFFRIMKMDSSFLDSPVSSWHLSAEYMDAVKVVNNMCVVNNAAERGVKLCSDFITCARIQEGGQPTEHFAGC